MDLKRFEDYKREVILAYEKKKKEEKLSPNLVRHTPARLKKECLNEFSSRYLDKDSPTFASLLGKGNNAEEYLKMLEKADPDLFRPLNNFLNKRTSGTRDTSIELLAWLIDFEQRPHRPGDIYEIVKEDRNSLTNETAPDTSAIEDPQKEVQTEKLIITDPTNIPEEKDNNEGSNSSSINNIDEIPDMSIISIDEIQNDSTVNFGIPRKFNKSILAFFAAFIIFSGSYIVYIIRDHECMYWDGNQYQSIDCDKKVNGVTIIPLDTSRSAHLKRITNLSSITINDIGKIYYSKVYGKVEFYTAGGDNPNDSRKRLLPMTKYMYDKYIPHK